MKIAFLLTQSLDSPSGLGRYWPLARELNRLGHRISIFATHPDYSKLEKQSFKEEGVLIHYVAPMHIQKKGNRKIYYSSPKLVTNILVSTWRLSLAALRSDADLIHVGKPHPMNGIAGLVGGKIKGSRLYLDCDDFEAGSNRFQSGWQQSSLAKFEQWMPKQTSLITTNTYFMRDKLISWGIPPDKIVYLPNGVDRNRFKPIESNKVNDVRQKLSLSGKKVIAYIGTLSLPSHPVDLLLKSFAQMKSKYPGAVLLIVGAGEDYDLLNNLARDLSIRESTHFVGRVPPDQVRFYYHLADVIVDPVHNNSAAKGRSPLKMFESWACGIPFVTADVGDRKTIMGEPPAGMLAKPGDPESLGNCILQIISDTQLAQELIVRGVRRVEEFYWDNIAKNIEYIYQ